MWSLTQYMSVQFQNLDRAVSGQLVLSTYECTVICVQFFWSGTGRHSTATMNCHLMAALPPWPQPGHLLFRGCYLTPGHLLLWCQDYSRWDLSTRKHRRSAEMLKYCSERLVYCHWSPQLLYTQRCMGPAQVILKQVFWTGMQDFPLTRYDHLLHDYPSRFLSPTFQ